MTTEDHDYTELGTGFGEVLTDCLEKGMQPPLLLAIVASNGACTIERLTQSEQHEGFDYEVLSAHSVDRGMKLPINMMVVDAKGEAARIVIAQDGATWH